MQTGLRPRTSPLTFHLLVLALSLPFWLLGAVVVTGTITAVVAMVVTALWGARTLARSRWAVTNAALVR